MNNNTTHTARSLSSEYLILIAKLKPLGRWDEPSYMIEFFDVGEKSPYLRNLKASKNDVVSLLNDLPFASNSDREAVLQECRTGREVTVGKLAYMETCTWTSIYVGLREAMLTR